MRVKKFISGSLLVVAGMAAGLGLAAGNKKIRKYIVDLGEKVDEKVDEGLNKLGKKKAEKVEDNEELPVVDDIADNNDKDKEDKKNERK